MGQDEKHVREDEIDLLELLLTIWKGRKKVVLALIIFGLFGLLVALLSSKEYTAQTIVVPQTQGANKSGGLGGLAAIAGVSLGGNSSNDISPMLYPKVVNSAPFLKELLKVSLKFEGIDREITYEEYYTSYRKISFLDLIKKYTIGLPGVILKAFKGDGKTLTYSSEKNEDIYRITKKEKALFGKIQSQLIVESNSKEGFVSISYTMPEADPSARMAQKAKELLQDFITKFKISKAEEELVFIKERYEEAKKEFNKKRFALANYQDRNQGLVTSRSRSRLNELQSDYNLAFGIYSELAKRLESQRIEVKKNTPEFTVIEPVSVPVQKSKPKRGMILFVWLFLGLVVGIGYIFINKFLKNIKKYKVFTNS